jgi:hypothetical protein
MDNLIDNLKPRYGAAWTTWTTFFFIVVVYKKRKKERDKEGKGIHEHKE